MNPAKSVPIFCALCALPAAWADTPAPSTTAVPAVATDALPQSLDLGSIHVKGKHQVAQVLATIKQALKAPDSTDAKHRDDLVCRMVHELADPHTYLDCATNATNQHRRTSTQVSRLAAVCSSQTCDKPQDFQSIAHTLVANQPDDRLHVQVNPRDFRQMLDSVTVAPTQSTAATPTAGTTAAPASTSHTLR